MSENVSESDSALSEKQQSTEGDEQIQSMSVGEIDPAILCVRERVMVRYSKEDLLDLAKSPLAKIINDLVDTNLSCFTTFDPERCNWVRKKSDTTEVSIKTDNGDNRRRSGDPRERIRKENDGIVLSPQRRSFNSGCFVPANKEPLGAKGDAPPPHIIGVRDITTSNRRIGSGRIVRDSWDSNEKDQGGESEYNFNRRSDDKFNDRNNRDDNRNLGERRSFGREVDNKLKEPGRRNNNRFNDNRRRYSDSKEDEPEWFSSGPLSQNDTIELRGFDEPEKRGLAAAAAAGKNRASVARRNRNMKRQKEYFEKKEASIAEGTESETESSRDRSSPNLDDDEPEEPKSGQNNSFDFDEFLKGENIPALLTNGMGEGDVDKATSTSRFSRWFKKESPNKDESGRKSSFHEDSHIMKDLLKDINDSSAIPDPDTYFAPISPAGLDGSEKGRSGQSVNLMEMLTRNKQGQSAESGWNSKMTGSGGKILSLDELEAKIRQPNSDHKQPKSAPQKPDEEMTAAFQKLLQQASGWGGVPQNGPINKPPGMSLLEMLNHSQQQDEARVAASQHHLLTNIHPQQHTIHNDLAFKLQTQQKQQQLDMLGKLMSAGALPTAAAVRASPLLDMGPQQSRELLNRPEAQAILQGLSRGEITVQHLHQQLANPALQPRHREMLVTILKLNGNSANYGLSPRVLSPVPILPSHHLYPSQPQQQSQQQQLRVSPLPPNAYCVSPIMATSPNHLAVPAMHQRIPSPRELQVHTQNILQRALIKKKLEEQSENFRKKQELQRGSSPNLIGVSQVGSGKGIASPTPLAFTPTSVLRKMTADKEDGKENKSVGDNGMKLPQGRPLTGMRPQPSVNNPQWNPAFSVKQAGRPIVKANNYQSQTPDQFFAQLAAQQQQPLPQQRTYQSIPATGFRKPIVGQQYSGQAPSQYAVGSSHSKYQSNQSQNFQQPTPQQLRAQHQHRPTTNTAVAAAAVVQPQNNVPKKQPIAPPQLNQGSAAWHQFLNSASQQQSERQGLAGTNPTTPQTGPLSPSTADQLTRWFSPDLLERARGGELPSTANLARLEEIERHAAPPVHN